ncbi:hypothetical protein AKJ54_01175 [candidate division MSBL1 archaeon SCGC-AAA382K21]|uniref:AbiEi antitoxin N-terminal domain-containing protein n=1 Tax=candidate division MSBL1 archaeon SCGC-AAA382K21 TaxID=1698283 RepID=A0A133VJU6_9EURY|nr:hypothetical protein AKJ54_01175 [candidate division MSBL1 archaeon SCGC-AAA382K21]
MSKMKKVLELVEEKGIIRPKDLQEEGLPKKYIYRLYDQGKLEKIDRGLYKLAGKSFSENEMMLSVARKSPDAAFCLLTALRFYEMTTQNPHQIWVAIHHKDKEPSINVPLKVVRMTGKSLKGGIEKREVDNVPIRVFNPAKTVADCFKFRNKIGLEVALEALREYKSKDMGTMSELWEFAKVDRVQNVIQPYAESMQ